MIALLAITAYGVSLATLIVAMFVDAWNGREPWAGRDQ